jgi:hypothetical protein
MIGREYGIGANGVGKGIRTYSTLAVSTPRAPDWPDERVEHLKRLVSEGYSAGSAGKILGVGKSAAMGKARRLGLRFKSGENPSRQVRPTVYTLSTPWSVADAKRLTQMWNAGEPIATMIAELGRTRKGIYGKVDLLGLPRRKRVSAQNADSPPRPGDELERSAGRYITPAIDIATARPWTTRQFGECAAPVSGEGHDTRSCCQPVLSDKTSWCAGHYALFHVPSRRAA